MTQQDPARVLVAIAAETDDKSIWSRLKMLPELFAAGPVAMRVGFFGAEGARSSRPFMVSRWTTDSADLADLLEKARTRCICGCYVRVSSILEQALRETQQGPLRAVVIIGDSFHGELDATIAIARQLRAAGTRLFLFQQGNSDLTERSFRLLAETTGGPISHSILTSSESPNDCRDCLRRSPISRSVACLLWKRAVTRRPACYSNR
jgi:hypothetical protein